MSRQQPGRGGPSLRLAETLDRGAAGGQRVGFTPPKLAVPNAAALSDKPTQLLDLVVLEKADGGPTIGAEET